jgi:Zn-dependent peptidase ImmA (M78 family)
MRRLEQAAEAVLTKARVESPPVDPEHLAKELGLEVVFDDFEPGVSGMLYRQDDGLDLIAVNAKHARVRQRFTIAHELGHYLLHAGRPIIVDHLVRARLNFRDEESSLATNREEIEANGFGAAVLMPAAWVDEAVEALLHLPSTRLVRLLASQFDVSTQAMELRLVNLGIRATP